MLPESGYYHGANRPTLRRALASEGITFNGYIGCQTNTELRSRSSSIIFRHLLSSLIESLNIILGSVCCLPSTSKHHLIMVSEPWTSDQIHCKRPYHVFVLTMIHLMWYFCLLLLFFFSPTGFRKN